MDDSEVLHRINSLAEEEERLWSLGSEEGGLTTEQDARLHELQCPARPGLRPPRPAPGATGRGAQPGRGPSTAAGGRRELPAVAAAGTSVGSPCSTSHAAPSRSSRDGSRTVSTNHHSPTTRSGGDVHNHVAVAVELDPMQVRQGVDERRLDRHRLRPRRPAHLVVDVLRGEARVTNSTATVRRGTVEARASSIAIPTWTSPLSTTTSRPGCRGGARRISSRSDRVAVPLVVVGPVPSRSDELDHGERP